LRLHRDPEEDVLAARPVLTIIAVGTLIFGALIAGMGIVLVYLGSTGAARIRFFGQSFDSANVGIGAIFLGSVTVVIILTALMKHLYALANIGRQADGHQKE
jgi:hypothetical protein